MLWLWDYVAADLRDLELFWVAALLVGLLDFSVVVNFGLVVNFLVTLDFSCTWAAGGSSLTEGTEVERTLVGLGLVECLW